MEHRFAKLMEKQSRNLGSLLGSLVWRALTRYGRIKYRYLLPIYRALGLMPSDQKSKGTDLPTRTLRGAQAIVRVLNRPLYQDQLKAVIERVKSSKGAVIFLPSVGWEIVNTQRTQHLAREFARQGYVSVFDSSNSYDNVDGFREIEPNLFLFRGSDEILPQIPGSLLWTLTYNFDRRKTYPSTFRTVYDWIDDFDVFNFDRSFLESNHARALREATVVASVARQLHEQARAVRPDALYLPNGVEYYHFSQGAAALPTDFSRKEERPIVGYFGAMAEWFDYEMLDEAARIRADWDFLLIGPMYDNSLRERGRLLLGRPNIHWLGQRKYETLPSYLRLFDVAMIPFVINQITLATSPLKLFEYFAGGKPVIATPMPECQAIEEVTIVGTAEELANALDGARRAGEDATYRERLRNLGRENSWTARVASLLARLEGRS
jgi:glycosyltransferase involved in cell wall biosynthesis